MSFQLPFESTRISKFLESKRKIIPSFWSSIREASLAELALQLSRVLMANAVLDDKQQKLNCNKFHFISNESIKTKNLSHVFIVR